VALVELFDIIINVVVVDMFFEFIHGVSFLFADTTFPTVRFYNLNMRIVMLPACLDMLSVNPFW